MIAWTTIENALRAWLATAIGGEVIWANQGAPAPAMPYGTLKITGPRQLTPLPATVNEYLPAAPPGQEIEQTVVLHEEITVSCQVYAAVTTGAGTARELLELARVALQLPSPRQALRAAGLAVVEVSDTRDLTALVETVWQSRALMDVRMNLVDTGSERTTFIERVTPPAGQLT